MTFDTPPPAAPVSPSLKFSPQKHKLLTLAAGCFWGTEHMLRKHLGHKIVDLVAGYANGNVPTDTKGVTYERVCVGNTNFAEVVQVAFDPEVLGLSELCDFFFRMHDPTTLNAQGPDVGTQYRSALYAHSDEDLSQVRQILERWQPRWANCIKTEVALAESFYDAEEYHQRYLTNNPTGYQCPTHYLRNV
ncbi:AFR239Wp [Eremothecium gossypii ATCC 10895]|uniref:peptide-methionine (S)-S-oxide reductase n=1 Tax=Eremothecium gossypii (strain ATCC 10895 / CBS 109.51 / FGSC 9923 / NRRL Y-1056) TaxID=284811 RepID=Q753T7_EREGS|nr:AFR239Wp [Eremothecium gossypii ATCC 10895]AAS53610.2 AFR239Wp [Eremothecium gossypii ATCC 10895]AEY97923.1 FAFR239Wp [Eremothecium gossypii FDAG1]